MSFQRLDKLSSGMKELFNILGQLLLLQYLKVPSRIEDLSSWEVLEFQMRFQFVSLKILPTGTGKIVEQHRNVSPSGLMYASSNGTLQNFPTYRLGVSVRRENS